jgi:3-oxoacyl-[acyl-carrier-protein] synthase-3
MKLKVGLETVVSEFPDTVVKNTDYSYLEPFIPEPIRGIFRFPKEIRRLRNDDAAEILAEKVAKKALDRAGLRPADIDYIIANNCGGKYVVPMVGCDIHHKLGFREETPVLNISNACASFVDACEVAWNFILAGKYKRVLVVTVSAWETKGGQARADLSDPMSVLMGDGAGAAIVSSQNLKCEFLSYYNRTWGEAYDYCGADIRTPARPELKQAADQPPMSNYLYGTPQFFEWWQRVGLSFGINGINGALMRANLTLDDLDIVFFHQPADMLYDMWIEGAAKAGLSKDKWKHTWDKYGNLSNAVVPCNLAEFWENGELKKNSIMAWITIGAGAHAPTMIVKWLVK